MERLQKYLSAQGIASRRKCEELIKEGKVKVNGKIVKVLGTKVSKTDEVLVDNKPVNNIEKEYYLLYKPEGVISSVKDEKNRKTVVDLIDTKARIYPVGRLDYDTSGIILLTNDGELSNLLSHPSGNIEKLYSVKVSGILKGNHIKMLESGIVIDGMKTKKAKAKLKKIDKANQKSYIELTITEGRNHQVKNMFNALGFKVVKLKRLKYSFLDLTGLKKGEYRPLTIKEVKQLYNIANNQTK
ncbi:MAG: rRNA pseudouridine synthase [Bacilli bacterium]|nr:rRNA pseudouridine synthase [Bacilli bacterium]